MLLRGKLLGGALFAGALFGATVSDEVVQVGGFTPAQRAMRHTVARPVSQEAVDEVKQVVDIREEDDMILQLIITAVTREIL